MNKTEISARQMEALLALFYFGSSLLTGGSSLAKQDTWFCLVMGALLSCLLLWLYSAVIDLYPGRDYYGNMVKACGKIPGKLLVLILSLYALFTGAHILRTEAEFIHIVNLTDTPLLALLASLIGVTVYALKHRLYVLARVAKFLLPLVYLSVILTVFFSIKDLHFSNMKPFLNTGFPTIAGGSLMFLSLPFGESVTVASIFGELNGKARTYPVFLKGALLGFILMLIANLRNLLVLGDSAGYYSFPSYAGVSVIAFGEFFSKVEVLIGINLLLGGIYKVCVLLFCTCSGLANVFGFKDYEPLVASCGLALMTTAVFSETNLQELFEFLRFIPYYSLPIQILIPLAVLIAGRVRRSGTLSRGFAALRKRRAGRSAKAGSGRSGGFFLFRLRFCRPGSAGQFGQVRGLH